jgi:hypothetical protein
MTTGKTRTDDLAALAEQVGELRLDVASLMNIAALFYEAGRADALGLTPRPSRPLRAIRGDR